MLRNRQSFARQWGWLVAFGLLLTTLTGRAQTFPLQVQVSVLPPYSAYLQDYPGAGQQVRVFIINTSRQTYQIRLAGQLTGDNGIEIRTSANYRPPRPLTVPPGQTLLSRTDLEGLFDLNQVEVAGIDKNLLARGLPLPDGIYQLCIRAFNETPTNTAAVAFGQPLSAEFPIGCSAPIIVRSVEPPILIAPLCDAEVTATNPQALVFTWTPPVGVSPVSVEYILRVVELPQADVDPNVFIDAVALPRSGVEVRGLRTSTFLYGPTQPPLQLGKRYAWRVQAIDRSGRLHFQNDGKAPVCSFTYGTGLPPLTKTPGMELVQTPAKLLPIPGLTGQDTSPAGATATAMMYKSEPIGATCSCKQVPTGGTDVDNKPALEAGKATVAGFPITFLKTADGVREENGLLTGNATIPMPIVNYGNVKLRVQLVNVQCNKSGEVIGGYVQAIRSGDFPGIFPAYSKPSVTPPALPSISTANADSVGSQIQKLGEQIRNFPGHLLTQAGNVAQSVGMDVPFGIDKSFGPISTNIAVTDVIFTPEDAYFNATTFIESPGLSAQFNGIPLAGYHICIRPDGTCGDKVLYLAKDMAASSLLTLKGGMVSLGSLQNTVTHVKFDEKGFSSMHIAAGINTPGLLRKADNAPLELLANFDLLTPDFENWTADVRSDDDFYVAGLSDIVLSMKDANGEVQPAIYDHDNAKNPGAIPAGYDPGKDPTWHGLFLPKLTITLPFLKSLNNGSEVPVSVSNMIYDSNGFTGEAVAGDEAHPIIAIGQGNLASWYCSADQLRLSFLQSSFKTSSLTGRVVLPICKVNDKAAPIPYTCTLAKAGDNLDAQFVLQPTQQIHTDVFGVADIALEPSSTVSVSYVSGAFSAGALLSGKISLAAGPLKMDLIQFQEMGMSTANGFSLKSLSTASPQKFIAGLPFTVDTPADKPFFSPLGSNQYSLNFIGGLDLADGIGLKANVGAALKFSTGLLSGRPDWKYVGTDVTEIAVDGAFGPISVTGTVQFTQNDAQYGNGFRGKVQLIMPFGGFDVQGYFGQKDKSRYWGVAGQYVLPAGVPGVPLVPGILFVRGFGGGVFSNMTKASNGSYIPATGALTFKAEMVVGTGDGTLLTAIGGLTVGITKQETGCSVDFIEINADAYLLSKPNDYKSSLATGHGDLKWDIAHGLFTADFGLTAAYKAGGFGVTAQASMKLQVDPGKDSWYFSFGEPDGRVTTTVVVANKPLFTAGAYFMTGNDLHGVVLPPSPYGMSPADLKKLGYSDDEAAKAAFASSVKKFLAFGVGYKIDVPRYELGPFYVKFDGSLGFDAMLSEQSGCANVAEGGQLGVNGWYASAQAYAQASIALGLHIDVWFYEGDLEVLSVSAGVLLRGGLPNPIWFRGNGYFRYRALAGRIRGGVNIEFWYNKESKCEPQFEPANPFADQPLIASIGPGGKNKISTLSPFRAEFNYPMESMIEVEGTDPKGTEFRQRFRIQFRPGQRFGFTVTNTGGASADLTQCAADQNGRLVWGKNDEGEANYSATFYRNTALLPNAAYTMTLGVVVYQYPVPAAYAPSGMYNPKQAEIYTYPKNKPGVASKPVEQIETLAFNTNDCASTLTKDGPDATVSFSYPFEGQRYYMKGGTSVAFVRLRAKLCCGNLGASDPNFKLMARITPYNAGKFDPKADGLLTPATFKDTDGGAHGGNLYVYTMPNGLKNSTLYRFDLVRIPTDGYIAQLEKDAKAHAQKAKNWTGAGGMTQGIGAVGGGPSVNGMNLPGPKLGTGPMPAGMGGNTQSTSGGTVTFASLKNDVDGVASREQKSWLDQQQSGFILDKSSLKETTMKSFGISVSEQAKGDEVDYRQAYEQILYGYYFKTSRYSTLDEKVANTRLIPLKQSIEKTQNDNRYVVPVECDENYETYELLPTKLGDELTMPPFLWLRGTTEGTYFKESIFPSLTKVGALAQPVEILPMLPKEVAVPVGMANPQELADAMTSWYYTAGKGPEQPLSKVTIEGLLNPTRPAPIIIK